MPRLHFRALAALLLGCVMTAQGTPTLDERKEQIQAMESNPSAQALHRKTASQGILETERIPLNPFLPVIEDETEARPRTKEQVVHRTLALLLVALKGEGLDQRVAQQLVEDYHIAPYFTPDERAFIEDRSPTDHHRMQFTWRYEAAWTLLWSLGYVDTLEKPVDICDVPKAVAFMRQRTAEQFMADAQLRPLPEVLDQADRIYRYHWAVVDARIKGQEPPAGLDPGVTLERHHALNWLIGYMAQEWDDVSTDT